MSLLTVSSQEEQEMVYDKIAEHFQTPSAFWISLKRGQGEMGDKVRFRQSIFANMCFRASSFLGNTRIMEASDAVF